MVYVVVVEEAELWLSTVNGTTTFLGGTITVK